NSEGREARGPSRRAADEVRARHQPQDCEGSRPHDPAIADAARKSGYRVVNRRAFVTGLGAAVAAPLGAEAQQAAPDASRRGRRARVGYLGSGHPSDRTSPRFSYLFDSFASGLRVLGSVDCQTVTIEWEVAEK